MKGLFLSYRDRQKSPACNRGQLRNLAISTKPANLAPPNVTSNMKDSPINAKLRKPSNRWAKSMRIALIVTLSVLFSCSSSREKDSPVKCLQSIEAQQLVLHQSAIDSTISFYAPKSWLTEFKFNPESTWVMSFDTAKDLDRTIVVSKTSSYFPANELEIFYKTCSSHLINELGIEILDSGMYFLNESQIHWVKYYNPSDTLFKNNTNLELFYAEKPGISNFRIQVHGEEKTEERICEGYQIFLANK